MKEYENKIQDDYMKEYKVEKITKYEALDKVNKEIRSYALLSICGLLAMAYILGLACENIIEFIFMFPIVSSGGKILDGLDDSMKLKKELLNLRKNEMVDQRLIDKIGSLTDEEIRSIRKR